MGPFIYLSRKLKGKIIGRLEAQIKDQKEQIKNLRIRTNMLTEMAAGIKSGRQIQFRGQVDQDLLAYLFFKGRKNGFYIDIGANDGLTLSNTYAFEQLGWMGACVEPVPDVFLKLRQNRKCDCYNAAITDQSGNEVNFIKASGVDMLSGLESDMTEGHKKRIMDEKGKLEIIKVKTLSFNELMSNYADTGFIDFMSIDVEGAEMSILKAIDFDKYCFGLITVENNEEAAGNIGDMKKYMMEKGYEVFLDLGLDIMFTPSIKRNG
jgi:FkbM family methyltransferase